MCWSVRRDAYRSGMLISASCMERATSREYRRAALMGVIQSIAMFANNDIHKAPIPENHSPLACTGETQLSPSDNLKKV